MEVMMTELEHKILDLYDLGWTADDIGTELGVDPNLAAEVIDAYLEDEADPGDQDGDHGSALASAGWGTDEDYGGSPDYDW